MTETKHTLLFIPDISGFTDFVNTNEISHSEHIITELLEVIINSDQNKMIVSEIEGDAVFFYKDRIPDTTTLIEQCIYTYKNFHNHLNRYDVERICRCGACETASKLTLKFIIHLGEVKKINIKEHNKLHGSDVILVHRLLKNSIPGKEYILLSDSVNFNKEIINPAKLNWARVEVGKEEYDDLANIRYSYISLADLPFKKQQIPSINFPELSSEKVSFQKSVRAPIDLVYENFTNFNKRMEWNKDIKDIIMRDKRLNQTGSLHTCLVGNQTLDIESIGRIEDKRSIIYGERLNRFKGLRDIISIYTFEIKDDQTIIKAEVDFKIKSFLGKLMKSFIKKMIQRQTEKSLQKLKIASEKRDS